jgi:hypothetical protein
VDQKHVSVTVTGNAEGLAGTDGDNPDLNAGLFGEMWQEVVVEPGVFSRCRRGDHDEWCPAHRLKRKEQQAERQGDRYLKA